MIKGFQFKSESGFLDVYGYIVECNVCRRKVFLEFAVNGSPHHSEPQITCGECLVISDGYRAAHPEAAILIEEALNEKIS